MVKKMAFCLVASLFIAGCSPGTVIRLSPGYTSPDAGNATLGVIIVKNRIRVNNAEDVDRCLGGGDPVESFYSFFTSFFPQKLKNACRFKNVVMLHDPNLTAFHPEQVEGSSKDERWDLMIPNGRDALPDSVKYLLIFSSFTVGGEFNEGSQGVVFLTGSSIMKNCSIKSIAIATLWDNTAGRKAAVGRIINEAGSQMMISKNTWFEMLDGIAREFAEKCSVAKQ
jgi:hypothetical protein